MKTRLILATACVFFEVAFARPGGMAQTKELHAPGYYIAINAQRDYEGVIRVRGASSLPAGANIALLVDDRWPADMCVAVDQKGQFRAELQVSKDLYHTKGLIVTAIFQTDRCPQPKEVIRVVGRHGELLGHDARPVTMDEVRNGWTPGMAANPQLFQVSGWYFGIESIAKID